MNNKETKCRKKFDDSTAPDEANYFNSTLSDSSGFQNLYPNFLLYKKQKITNFNPNSLVWQSDLNQLDKTIRQVYKQLTKGDRQILLVVGQVQSGKTDFMIGLTSQIITEQHKTINIIINLTSNLKNISQQTYDRFNDFYKQVEVNEIVELWNFNDLKHMQRQQIIPENNGLFFLLKNQSHLNWLTKYLNFLNQSQCNLNITILDDEGDNASFNTNTKANTDDELSSINKTLSNLIKQPLRFPLNLVSVTATPLVHYFSPNHNNLKPDFAFLLEAGQNYTGVLEFNDELNQFDSKVINRIADDDQDCVEKNNSLERAIICYFALCVLDQKSIYGNENIKPRMMISMDSKKEQHEELKRQISQWLKRYKSRPELIATHLVNYQIWDLIPTSIPSTVEAKQRLINNIQSLILKNRYEIIVSNSDNDNPKSANFDNDETKKFQIIIGAYKLSRGITLKNLICVYMSIRALEGSKMDVLLQRARWFGYHQNHLKYMRIFLTNELITDYTLTAGLMNNLYNTIRYAQENRLSFKAIERYLAVQEFKADLQPVNNRAPTRWETTSLKNSFIRNKCKYSNDTMGELLIQFQNDWQDQYEPKSRYPIVTFTNLKTLIQRWFLNESAFCNAVGMSIQDFNHFVIENDLLNQPAYVRLINANTTSIHYRSRLITSSTYSREYVFGNGNYHAEYAQQPNQIKLDLLPLKIWTKTQEQLDNVQRNIFRLKLFLPTEMPQNPKGSHGIRGI